MALVVDDSIHDIDLISTIIRSDYEVVSVSSPEAAMERLRSRVPDIVLLDLDFKTEKTGIDALRSIRAAEPDLPVIMVTHSTSTTEAVECIKAGAFHFVEKPSLTKSALLSLMARAIDQRQERRAASSAKEQVRSVVGEIVGRSRPLLEMLNDVDKIAPTKATVLIVGESGTGKELVARRLHERSDRSDGPLVMVACPAVPRSVMESEFFGVNKGAFTDAIPREGRFELASGGTIILDEIADIDSAVQAKLLRVLEGDVCAFERVGGGATIAVDVRVVSVTNRDLPKMASEGAFRNDLFFRLSTCMIQVPPLRSHLEDVPCLVEYFVSRFSKQLGRSEPRVSQTAIEKLQRYDWRRNNVRELRNCVEAAIIRCDGEQLDARDFQIPDSGERGSGGGSPPSGATYEAAKLRFEREYVGSLLDATAGNITKAAESAGMSRKAMYDMIKRAGIEPRDHRHG